MTTPKYYLDKIILFLKAIFVFALTAVICLLLYQHDNKYTASGPQGKNGILILNNGVLDNQPLLFLTDGWEYYANRLLTPEDFTEVSPLPDQYLFIGQYGGFDMGTNSSPHGSASYRLTIQIPDKSAYYTLYIPEIFSAYKCYVNGNLAAQLGNPTPHNYEAKTGNSSITIEAANHIEIIFAVSDYSHLYSGMVYPPVFGKPTSVAHFLNTRLIFRTLLCASAFTICILSALASLFTQKTPLSLLFSLLCFFFIGYTIYPLTKTLHINFKYLYATENIAFCATLCLVSLLTMLICNCHVKWCWAFIVFGVLMCGASLTLHLLLPTGNLLIMHLYSIIVSFYEWSTVVFILSIALLALKKYTDLAKPLFYGIIIFSSALLMDRLLPLYEPILTGWFTELACFALIFCIGIVIVQKVIYQYHEGIVATERIYGMERLYKSQLSYYKTLQQEIENTKTMRHDMRHHLTVINAFLQQQQYQQLGEYLSASQLSYSDEKMPEYCPINVINILTYHYTTIAKQHKIQLDIRCDTNALLQKTTPLQISDADLCCLYSNLIENAIEACTRSGHVHPHIRISIVCPTAQQLIIHLWNTAQNVQPKGSIFHSSKENSTSGYGLLSVKKIAQKHEGTASFHWHSSKDEFESIITIVI